MKGGESMACVYFKESFEECLFCTDSRCELKGGEIDPHNMCGCEACECHSMLGDRPICINADFVQSS